LGLWAAAFSLEGSLPGLAVILLLSAGTWSSLFAWILPVMIFPLSPIPAQKQAKASLVAALLAAAVYLLGVFISYGCLGFRPYPHAQQVLAAWVPISAFVAAAYLALGIQRLQEGLGVREACSAFKSVSWRGLAASLACVALVRAVFRFGLHLPHVNAGGMLLAGQNSIFVRSITLPGIFLVAHAVYYGPMFLLYLVLWKDISQDVRQLGYGYLLIAAFTMVLSLNSESRHWLHAYPFLAVLGLRAIQRRGLERKLWPALVFGTLAASKTWFHINAPLMYGPYTQFPGQRLFMNKGPWMSADMYLVQGLVALAFLALLVRLCRDSVRT
jgi:hypothetical protein